MFPPELERDAFRADNGEFGWTRAQIPQVVNTLVGNCPLPARALPICRLGFLL
jgi:hypothetical protein